METTQKEKKNGSRFGLIVRWVAGVLAVIMLLTALELTRIVSPAKAEDETQAAEKAFAALKQDDAYLNASALERVGMLLSTIGKRERTYADYQNLASIYTGRGEYAEAAVLLKEAADTLPANDTETLPQAYLRLGSAYVLSGQYAPARESYERALALDAGLTLARMLLAQTCIEQKDYPAAAIELTTYLQQAPDDTDSRRVLGTLYELMQDYTMAYHQYLRAFEATQSDEDRLSLARAALLSERYEAAAEHFTAYLTKRDDPDGSVHYMRALAYLSLGRFSDAEPDLLAAVDGGYPKPSDCYVQLAACAYERQGYEDTLKYGRLAAESWEKPDGACLQRMGVAALQMADYAGAARYLRESSAADATLTDNDFLLGTAYLLDGAYASAVDAYTRSVDAGVRVSECRYQRGVCLLQLGRYEEGLTDVLYAAGDDADPATQTLALNLLKELGVTITEQAG